MKNKEVSSPHDLGEEKVQVSNSKQELISEFSKKEYLINKNKLREKKADYILSNIGTFLDEYLKFNLTIVDYNIMPWDIVEINFYKNNNKKDIINLKLLIFQNKTKKVVWFIKITDLEKNITSQAKIWTIIMPIIQYWKRRIDLDLKWALYILLKDFLQEKSIKNIVLYKKNKQLEGKQILKQQEDIKTRQKQNNNKHNNIIYFFKEKLFKIMKK